MLNKVTGLEGTQHSIVPFHPKHMQMGEYRSFDHELMNGFGKPFVADNALDGFSFTAMSDGKIYLMFGFYPLWNGVAECWMLPCSYLDEKKLIFHKATLKCFLHIAFVLELWRMQCYVRTTNGQATKWIEMCYFNREGLCRQFGPDKNDYYLYGRLF